MLFPPTFALPQKCPVREAFLASSSILVPIADSTTLGAKPVPTRCRTPWPKVSRRPASFCENRGSNANGADRGGQHPGSYRQGTSADPQGGLSTGNCARTSLLV